MTAVVVRDGLGPQVLRRWDQLLSEVNCQSGTLHWQRLQGDPRRQHVVRTIGSMNEVMLISVVICKQLLRAGHNLTDADRLYLWTLRLMLERLSWHAKDVGKTMTMTFAHVANFPKWKMDQYLAKLQETETKMIEWPHLHLPPTIASPANKRMLQIADSAAGAVFAAFNKDPYGGTNRIYLEHLKSRYWRRRGPITAAGLKVGGEGVSQAYPWLGQW